MEPRRKTSETHTNQPVPCRKATGKQRNFTGSLAPYSGRTSCGTFRSVPIIPASQSRYHYVVFLPADPHAIINDYLLPVPAVAFGRIHTVP
ncbi:unnamed protein product [Adineta ricciae]|uniref:Uncharacterized protein n=1 Tax=Adineta ricciae TaxID=249248 RepID=A0A815Z7G9_ADIRI|nr:unnamed protein product [Adineta ricciae]CAF1581182.1 unnamed protein product [Adineta ricciae]